MKKIYITWKLIKYNKHLFWDAEMQVSAPYDWEKDNGGIPWNKTYYFKTISCDRATKIINKKIYRLKKEQKYPIQLVFPSSYGENVDWA